MKNALVMIVVAVMAAGCAFLFVTRFYLSQEVYDFAQPVGAFTSESDIGNTEIDAAGGNDTGTEIDEKSEELKSKNKNRNKEQHKDKEGSDDNGKVNKVLDKILVPMDSIVVNLGKVDSKRYLRVLISLEVKDSETENTIKANKVVFRDKLVSYLSSKDVSEVSAQASHLDLRTEIKDMLNSELLGSHNAISQVYFSDFIIQ